MKLIAKGIIIGIGKILPGISGAMFAMILGEYERIIDSIATLKYNFKEKFIYLSKVGIGIIIAISLLSKIIVKCIKEYYFLTMLLFAGLIVGDIINSNKKIEKQNKKKKYLKMCSISILIIILYLFINNIDINLGIRYENDNLKYSFVKLIIIGIIESISSIIPGISGTALLISLGYYNLILNAFSTIFKYTKIIKNISILFPLFLGFILGGLITCKIINKINKKKLEKLKYIFEIISIKIIIGQIGKCTITLTEIYIGITLFIVTLILSNLILNKRI